MYTTSDEPQQIIAKPEPVPVIPTEKEKFFPSGAIVFFILLVILALLFWYGIYFLMIERT